MVVSLTPQDAQHGDFCCQNILLISLLHVLLRHPNPPCCRINPEESPQLGPPGSRCPPPDQPPCSTNSSACAKCGACFTELPTGGRPNATDVARCVIDCFAYIHAFDSTSNLQLHLTADGLLSKPCSSYEPNGKREAHLWVHIGLSYACSQQLAKVAGEGCLSCVP